MIHTNLSTRPFYNTRAVSVWLLLLTLTVAGVTLFNVWRVLHYTQNDSVLATQATTDSARAAAARDGAAKLRASVDAREVALVSIEARKANDLIDRRTFSWTALLNQFEHTLPADVRITTVRPKVEDNRTVVITFTAVARTVGDVNEFMENLEETKAFAHLLVRDERMSDEDLVEVTLEANYEPKPAQPADQATAEAPPMTPLVARIAREKRAILIPLLLALVANLGVYVFIVRPMGNRSAGAAAAAAAATVAVETAEREQAMAVELVARKARADEALNAFYQKVLPANLTAARRMTYSSLPALAQRTNVRYETRRFDPLEPEKDARVAGLRIRMVLQGEYANLRQFIYQVESAPEFVIIDDMTLTEGQENESLTLSLDLSTYYTVRLNGA